MENADFRFIVDVHLGKLARYLRLCGLDTLFSVEYNDAEIIEISNSDDRIILTRDKLLIESKKVVKGLLIKSQDPSEQIKEVFARYDLQKRVTPFTRCMECNSLLVNVDKEMIIDLLEPRTREFYENFSICTSCNHIYWEGSHYQKMKNFVERLTG